MLKENFDNAVKHIWNVQFSNVCKTALWIKNSSGGSCWLWSLQNSYIKNIVFVSFMPVGVFRIIWCKTWRQKLCLL